MAARNLSHTINEGGPHSFGTLDQVERNRSSALS
jgi:hypothetical protein